MLPNKTPSTRNRLHLTSIKGVLEAYLLPQTPQAVLLLLCKLFHNLLLKAPHTYIIEHEKNGACTKLENSPLLTSVQSPRR